MITISIECPWCGCSNTHYVPVAQKAEVEISCMKCEQPIEISIDEVGAIEKIRRKYFF